MQDNEKGRLFGVALTLAVPVALLAGRWADRNDRPFVPLMIGASVSAMGLVGMALAGEADMAKASYLFFGIATTVFLSLQSVQTLSILPRSDRRGRDLGVFNLTNPVPSLLMTWMLFPLVPGFCFHSLFLLLALFPSA